MLDWPAGPVFPPAGLTWWWFPCRVLLKIIDVFTCRVLSLAVPAFRGDPAKDAGLIRHKNAVLRRHQQAGQSGGDYRSPSHIDYTGPHLRGGRRLPAGRRPRRPRMPALLGWLISQPGPPRAARRDTGAAAGHRSLWQAVAREPRDQDW